MKEVEVESFFNPKFQNELLRFMDLHPEFSWLALLLVLCAIVVMWGVLLYFLHDLMTMFSSYMKDYLKWGKPQ